MATNSCLPCTRFAVGCLTSQPPSASSSAAPGRAPQGRAGVRASVSHHVCGRHSIRARGMAAPPPGPGPAGRCRRPAGSMAADEDRARGTGCGRPRPAARSIIEAEPGSDYVDRETGEPLEVVGPAAAARPDPVRAAVGGREPPLLQLVRPARPEGPQRLPALRQADGAARLLRRRRRCWSSALDARWPPWPRLVLRRGLAACGGGSSDHATPSGAPDADRARGAAASAAVASAPRRRPRTLDHLSTPTGSDGGELGLGGSAPPAASAARRGAAHRAPAPAPVRLGRHERAGGDRRRPPAAAPSGGGRSSGSGSGGAGLGSAFCQQNPGAC